MDSPTVSDLQRTVEGSFDLHSAFHIVDSSGNAITDASMMRSIDKSAHRDRGDRTVRILMFSTLGSQFAQDRILHVCGGAEMLA